MLFQKNIVKKYLSLLNDEQTKEAWGRYQAYFLNAEIQQNIQQSKEEQFQEGFLHELFVKVLGYTLNPSPGYNAVIWGQVPESWQPSYPSTSVPATNITE